jgi:alpha-amylase
MPNPWNGKAVLEVFYWGRWNTLFPADWYTYLAKLCPTIAGLGKVSNH